jgi:transposase
VEKNITKVALDTHKKQHTAALLDCETGETEVFTVKNTLKDIKKMVAKIKKRFSGPFHFCYEAGVCGFVLKRRLEALGCQCDVIAPSLVPTKAGDRIKTNRRDAKKILGQFIAGELTVVYPPDPEQEAAREITRCRHAAQEDLKRIRHQLLKLLNRHGYLYPEGRHWTKKHLVWLKALEFDQSDLQLVFESYFTELQHGVSRLEGLDGEVGALAERPQYREVVGLLRCFRGIDTLTAITTVTEIIEFGRFESPRKLMCYLGLVPSEYSSGEKHNRGGITKAGNKRVRRLMVESAWHYRHRPWVGKDLKRRRKDQPQWAIDIADKAMARLYKRYWNLVNRGKMPTKVCIALSRELAGFIWSILHELQNRKMCQPA